MKKKVIIISSATAVLLIAVSAYFINNSNGKENDLNKGQPGVFNAGQPLGSKDKSTDEHKNHIVNEQLKNEVKASPIVQQVKEADLKNVSLSPSQQVLANVKVDTVKRKVLSKEINTVGKISYDETKLYHISSWIPGRINKIYTNSTGMRINKGDKMLEIYSPELVAAQQEYIQAYEAYKSLKSSEYKEISESYVSLMEASRQKLLLVGIKDWQIKAIQANRKPQINVPIFASASGVIVNKNIQEGHYIETGASLFDIADLSTVWLEANIYEFEMADIKAGQEIEISSDAYPGEVFTGKISFINLSLDSTSKTIKVRASFKNPDLKLKPEMVVNAKLTVSLGNPLIVAKSAVLMTGKNPVVWVEGDKNVFRPVEVKLGQSTDEYYPVLSGLKEGEKIAVSGGFLLDSESRINTGANPHAGMNMGDEKEKKKPDDMKNMKM